MRCQLHLNSQYIFSSSFSFCLSMHLILSIYFYGTCSNHWILGWEMLVCVCVCSSVLFKDRMSFSDLGFCSM